MIRTPKLSQNLTVEKLSKQIGTYICQKNRHFRNFLKITDCVEHGLIHLF